MIVAPSGDGKSSLVNAVLREDPDLMLSISCTTRPPRPGEEDDKHYRLVSIEHVEAMREADARLAWAEVHGNFYGTPRDRVDRALEENQDVLLEIDWQGARQVREHFPQAISIFILPPSIDSLESRLIKRGQDSPSVITRRLLAAGSEISHAPECQYVIINQEFNTAVHQLSQIFAATRLRYAAQSLRHADLFSQFGIK